jgi:hypothetical protein
VYSRALAQPRALTPGMAYLGKRANDPQTDLPAGLRMIRLRRTKSLVPLVRRYDVDVSPPDADEPWRPDAPVTALAVRRRLLAEGFYQRDVADLLLEADELWRSGERERWVEHAGVRPHRTAPEASAS